MTTYKADSLPDKLAHLRVTVKLSQPVVDGNRCLMQPFLHLPCIVFVPLRLYELCEHGRLGHLYNILIQCHTCHEYCSSLSNVNHQSMIQITT